MSGAVVAGPHSVLRQEVPFTKNIFVGSDPRCFDALRNRIDALDRQLDATVSEIPVNESVPNVIDGMPRLNAAVYEGFCRSAWSTRSGWTWTSTSSGG